MIFEDQQIPKAQTGQAAKFIEKNFDPNFSGMQSLPVNFHGRNQYRDIFDVTAHD